MTRIIKARYIDPLDQIWLSAAFRLGIKVQRPPAAPDECLAQIILHEVCRALVHGDSEPGRADDPVAELACLRTQAALLLPYGLREFLAPTTGRREFYDSLPPDPRASDPGDPSLPLTREALGRAARIPFDPILPDALRKTATIHDLVRDAHHVDGRPLVPLWHVGGLQGRHSTGRPLRPAEQGDAATCGSCAWRHVVRGVSRCRRGDRDGNEGPRVAPEEPACVLHEPQLDCLACGACCRHAFDRVSVRRGEQVCRTHPGLVEQDGPLYQLRRTGQRCAALHGPEEGPYRCAIYPDRPRVCREFPVGGRNCLLARRRVGLSL